MASFDARIKRGFGMICVGPPLSGKTHFTKSLLKHAARLIDGQFDYIYWFYGQQTASITELDDTIKTHAGLPENLDDVIQATNPVTGKPQHGLLVFDDLMQSVSANEGIARLAANRCQHENISWIVLLQNLFHRGNARLTLLRCCHYLVLFKNPLDHSTAHHLARRILPGKPEAFIRIYERATEKPNGYLFVDGRQSTPEDARFRTDIFNEVQRVFIPKAAKNVN